MNRRLTSTHVWMHRKIRFMEEYILYIIDAAKKAGWLRNGKRFVGNGMPSLKVLENITNIDDCLRAQIDSAERRYAQLVTNLTAGFPERLKKLERIAYSFGKRNCLESDATVIDAMNCLNDMFLEGMPDNPTYEVVEHHKRSVTWRWLKDIHRYYWIEAGGFPSDFQKMRQRFVDGLLSQCDIQIKKISPKQFVLSA